MTDARTGPDRRPVGGDVNPGGTAMPGRDERTTDWASVSGGTPGQEEPARMDDRDDRETDSGRGELLMPREECGQLERRLAHAVTGFVDEPRAAVEEADRAVEEISARLTDAVDRRRRTLRGSWQSADADRPGSADTEQLRLALRDYRELADRLLHM
ncbi:hypothetical protein ABT404_50615 [Streptomyces hyaluromycini]|uniref:Uncharacterized protein n=1 Tax=Streptomyces hyaluromycini TaxID=1377993 RepID=A0ABV1XFA4_9ACTN